MKKLLIGLIIGIFISSSAVFAANQLVANITNFPIILDGDKYTPINPVMVVNNTSYISSRDVGKILGKSINWNNSLKRIEYGENIPYYKFENLKFIIAGIGAKTAQFNDTFKPQDGNGFVSILLKATNIGNELAYLNKNDFYIETLDRKKINIMVSPVDNYFSEITLGSQEYNKIGLLFEIPKDDIAKNHSVNLIYKPTESKNECKMPINLIAERN